MKFADVKTRVVSAWSSVSIATYLLVVIFGTGSWIAVNGIWVELPIIVQHIPESWSLPSYLTVIIQLANIGPFLFTLGNKFYPRAIRETPTIFVILPVGALACGLLAFFWKETSHIAGAERSLALLILAFLVSVVDCTSSVTFLPFMAIFREVYMSPYFVGEGLSGLLPSLVALGQGVGAGASHQGCAAASTTAPPPLNSTNATNTNVTSAPWGGPGPKFSTAVFFWFLCGMMTASGLAFLGLNTLSFAKRQQVRQRNSKLGGEEAALHEGDHEMAKMADEEADSGEDSSDEGSTNPPATIFLLVALAVINGLSNGIIPAIQIYACIPYSYYIYHLTLTLSAIANPLTCFIFPLIRTKSTAILAVLSVIYCAMCTYIIVVASQSPNVLLRCDLIGAVLMVSKGRSQVIIPVI